MKKRMQAQSVFGLSAGSSYKGMVDCMTQISRKEGLRGFYRGLIPAVAKTGIASGLTFSIYRGTKNFLEALHDDFEQDKQRAEDKLFDR